MSGLLSSMHIELLMVKDLRPYPGNARTHDKKQLRQIAESIRTFGFVNPVLIDRANTIIAGHGRVEAAKLISLDKVPTLRIEHMTEAQIRAYAIADNRLAEKAGWDNQILAIELRDLLSLEPDLSIDVTGFSFPEIDFIIQSAAEEKSVDEDLAIDPSFPVVAKPGDLWQLGNHFTFCGNALEETSYQTLLAGQKAQLVFTDPPYNVPIPKHVCGLGKAKHENFAMASGEMTKSEFTDFLRTIFRSMVSHAELGSIHYVCMDWRHMSELTQAGEVFDELKNICVWNKDNAGMGSLYRSKHEFIAVFKFGMEPHINNIELGKNGRYRTNVWDYPGQTSLHARRGEELAMHPTVKPTALIADALLDCSHRGGIVLDPFGGSGTTLLAAEKTGRKARLIEIEPRYVDVTIRRWQKYTGKKAVHVASGDFFDDCIAH